MTVRFKRKVRSFRGKRYHGWGGKKKHRGKGSKGGSGWGGAHKHKKTYVYTRACEHFGYKGFHSLNSLKESVINIGLLDGIVQKSGRTEIDLGELGYTKLLGSGEISSPVVIKVSRASASAKEKIEKIGGKLEAEITNRDSGQKEREK